MASLALGDNGALLDLLVTLGKDELDMAGVGHVRVNLKTNYVSTLSILPRNCLLKTPVVIR